MKNICTRGVVKIALSIYTLALISGVWAAAARSFKTLGPTRSLSAGLLGNYAGGLSGGQILEHLSKIQDSEPTVHENAKETERYGHAYSHGDHGDYDGDDDFVGDKFSKDLGYKSTSIRVAEASAPQYKYPSEDHYGFGGPSGDIHSFHKLDANHDFGDAKHYQAYRNKEELKDFENFKGLKSHGETDGFSYYDFNAEYKGQKVGAKEHSDDAGKYDFPDEGKYDFKHESDKGEKFDFKPSSEDKFELKYDTESGKYNFGQGFEEKKYEFKPSFGLGKYSSKESDEAEKFKHDGKQEFDFKGKYSFEKPASEEKFNFKDYGKEEHDFEGKYNFEEPKGEEKYNFKDEEKHEYDFKGSSDEEKFNYKGDSDEKKYDFKASDDGGKFDFKDGSEFDGKYDFKGDDSDVGKYNFKESKESDAEFIKRLQEGHQMTSSKSHEAELSPGYDMKSFKNYHFKDDKDEHKNAISEEEFQKKYGDAYKNSDFGKDHHFDEGAKYDHSSLLESFGSEENYDHPSADSHVQVHRNEQTYGNKGKFVSKYEMHIKHDSGMHHQGVIRHLKN